MELNVVELAAQYGVMGGLLLAVMHWLVRHYLPDHERRHREELGAILEAHSSNTNRLVRAVERNTRVVQFNSQALLVQSFIGGGLCREDAELIAQRIQLTTLDGVAGCAGTTTPPVDGR